MADDPLAPPTEHDPEAAPSAESAGPTGSAEAAAADPAVAARTGGPATRARRAFRNWRRSRPFWGAVWAAWGGFVIFYLPLAPVTMLLHVGIGGIYGMAGGIIIMGMALLMLVMPSQRYVGGIVIVVVGTASFPLSNLGGFFVGMFFSILGGVMGFGWLPNKPARKRRWLRRSPAPQGPATQLTAQERSATA